MKKSILSVFKRFGFVLTLCICLLIGFAGRAKAAENDVKLNVSEVSIAKDETFRLRVYNVPSTARVMYRSGNPNVAYVDARGYITGISNGECKVTATVIDKGSPIATLTCNVLIGPAAISIKFTKTELVLQVGMRKTIKSIVSPLNTVERPVFYSMDKLIASVTSIGRVRAKNPGITKVFAFLKNDCSAECTVYVMDEEEYNQYIEDGDLTSFIEKYEKSEDDNADEAGDDTDDVTTDPDTDENLADDGNVSDKDNVSDSDNAPENGTDNGADIG